MLHERRVKNPQPREPHHIQTTTMPSEADAKQDKQTSAAQARQVIEVFHEISTLLVTPPAFCSRSSTDRVQNADLDRQTLSICISLIENGVNPEALAVRSS